MSAAPTVEVLQAMLELSDALRARLMDEKAALLAQPSPLFIPRSTTTEGRQLERDAFAKGLRIGTSRARHA